MMARTATTSFFDTTTILRLDVGCIPGKEGGVISMTMINYNNNNDGDDDAVVGAFLAYHSGGRQLADQLTNQPANQLIN